MRNLNSSGCPASCGEWSAKHEASNDAIGQSAAAAAGAAAEKDDRTERMEGGREKDADGGSRSAPLQRSRTTRWAE